MLNYNYSVYRVIKTLCNVFLFLSIYNLGIAEGTKQVSPTQEDIVILNILQEGFANYGSNGTAKGMCVTIKENTETVYIGLSQLALSSGALEERDYSFRIVNSDGEIVHGPFLLTAADINGNDYNQIIAGPDLNGDNTGYNISDSKFVFQPSLAGDYCIEFEVSPGSTIPYGPLYWDVTVTNTDNQAIDGRLWSKCWGFRTPCSQESNCTGDAFNKAFNGSVYALTDDGYVHALNFEGSGFRGLSFVLAFNSSGPGQTGDPAFDRRSVDGKDNNDDPATNPVFKVFLSDPDPVCYTEAIIGEVISGPEFSFDVCTFSDGIIDFELSKAGLVEVLIDLNGNDGVFTDGTEDILIVKRITALDPLANNVEWDLVDGLGNKISNDSEFSIYLTLFEGEIHFMQFDVEYNNPGFALEVLHPEENNYLNVFYYDDSNLDPSDRDPNLDSDQNPNTGPQPLLVELNGCNSPCHGWNFSGSGSNGYGESNTINTWWFGQVSAQATAVALSDMEPPTFDCPGDLAVECNTSIDTSVTGSITGIMDDCSSPTDIIITFTDNNNLTGCNGTGTITRKFFVEDGDGNIDSCEQILTIVDTNIPTIFCPDDIAINCNESIDTMDTGSPIASDLCGDVTITFEDTVTGFDGSCTNQVLGLITRMFTVTDACNLSNTCTQIITVVDVDPPTAVCSDITVDFMGESTVTIEAEIIGAGSTDNCTTDLVYNLAETTFDCSDFVLNNVLDVDLSILDACNNETICSAQITFVGLPDLSLSCPGDTTIQLGPGECDANYNYQILVDNPCGDPPVLVQTDNTGYTAGDNFPVGSTVQSYFVENEYGQMLECSFTVTVLEFVQSNFSLACNNELNISVDGQCEVLISADMILEGSHYGCYDDYYIGVHTVDTIEIDNPIITYDPGYSDNTFIISIIDPVTGNSCWSTVHLEDKWEPSIECDCPPGAWMTDNNCVKTCFQVDNIKNGTIGAPVVSDNCEGAKAVYGGYELTEGENCGEWIISQFWSVEIDTYNGQSYPEINCTNEFLITPLGLDAVTLAEDAFVDCSLAGNPELIHPDETGYPMLAGDQLGHSDENDNIYCMIFAGYTDLEIPACGANCDAIKIIRNWSLIDWCTQEVREVIQFVVIMDADAPTLQTPDIITSVDPWKCSTDIWINDVQVHDNCDYDLDWHLVTTNSGATLVDEDGSSNSPKPKKHAINVPKGEWEFIISSFDCCNNIAYDTISVVVKDLVAPVPVALQNVVISLTNGAVGPDGIAKIYPASLDEGSHDNCTNIDFEIRRETDNCGIIGNTTYSNILPSFCDPNYSPTDPDYGNYVKFCCADLTETSDEGMYGIVKVLLRVWDDANMDGVYGSYDYFDFTGTEHDYCEITDNYNEAWTYVRVESNTPPSIQCPVDITIPCDWDATDLSITGEPTGNSTCGVAEFSYIDWEETHCGEGYILREWSLEGTDNYTCTQRITITPVYAFDLTCPIDPVTQTNKVIVDCADYVIPEPIYSSGACNLVGVTSEIDTFWFEPGACFKAIKTWHFMDWCTEEEYSCEFIVSLVDTEAPDLMCQDTCFAVDDYWDADNDGNFCELTSDIVLHQMASDNGDCGSEWIKWIVKIDYWNDGIVEEEYTSFVPPSASNYIAPTLINTPVQIRLDKDQASAEWALHSVEWKAFDGCGNSSNCIQTVEVADKKAPTPYCIGLSTAPVNPKDDAFTEIWAIDFNQGSTDNCTVEEDLLFTFNEVAPVLDKINQEHCFDDSGNEVPCSQFENGYPIQKWVPEFNSSATKFVGLEWCGNNDLRISIWDNKLNTDFCWVNLLIHGEACDTIELAGAAIGGYIVTESGENIANVTVTNESNQVAYPKNMTTVENGFFSFSNNQVLEDYSLSASRTDSCLNGVSTVDIVLIQKHILGFDALDSPYKLIAADANNDQNITGVDIVEIRKLILGLISEYTSNDSWRFVDKDAYMDHLFPWPFIENANINALAQDMMTEDFIGIKIGDVNATAQANYSDPNPSSRSSQNLQLGIKATIDGKFEIIALEDVEEFYGMQFSMHLPGGISNIESGKLEIFNYNFNQVKKDEIRFSYSSALSKKIGVNDVLFTIHPSKEDIWTEIQLTHTLKPRAYIEKTLEEFNIQLKPVIQEPQSEFTVNNMYPNPFHEFITLDIHSKNKADYTIEIIDIQGKVCYQKSYNLNRGINTITVNSENKLLSGFYNLRIKTSQRSTSHKIYKIQ